MLFTCNKLTGHIEIRNLSLHSVPGQESLHWGWESGYVQSSASLSVLHSHFPQSPTTSFRPRAGCGLIILLLRISSLSFCGQMVLLLAFTHQPWVLTILPSSRRPSSIFLVILGLRKGQGEIWSFRTPVCSENTLKEDKTKSRLPS